MNFYYFKEVYITNKVKNIGYCHKNRDYNKKAVHKAAEAVGEFLLNKTADKIAKQKYVVDGNFKSLKWVEEIIIPSEKKMMWMH